LLDFGAGRDFEEDFLDTYLEIIHGSFVGDRAKIMKKSHELKFLTGEENREMQDAHHAGVMIVGEPFRTSNIDSLYDFASSDFSAKIGKVLPTMSKHRLTPPPQQIYSLHKKVIGTYLTCIKLKAKVPSRRIFEYTYENWKRMKTG
jgi:aarF domain-containing kinase